MQGLFMSWYTMKRRICEWSRPTVQRRIRRVHSEETRTSPGSEEKSIFRGRKQSNFYLHFHYFHQSKFYLHYNIYASWRGSLRSVLETSQKYFPPHDKILLSFWRNIPPQKHHQAFSSLKT